MTILHGDCRERLATLEDASVDAIVTDPPYELGFMGKRWDASGIAYDPTVWAECYRVLKPGGHVLAFGGTRTYHRMAVAIEDAGFEIRDSIHWLYGSGFPKSLNLNGDHAGWGTALKPAHEPIVVARKPLVGTVAANVLEHGTGALNINGTRIGNGGHLQWSSPRNMGCHGGSDSENSSAVRASSGRWPANLVLTHSPECQQTGTRRVKTGTASRNDGGGNTFGSDRAKPPLPDAGYADADGKETVPAYECVAGCPVAALNEQSGTLATNKPVAWKRSAETAETRRVQVAYGKRGAADSGEIRNAYSDSGGASRFFATFEWDPIADTVPFRYVAKPSRRERNAGLDGMPEQRRSTEYGALKVRECNACGSRSKRNGRWPDCDHDDWRWVEQHADGHKGGNAANTHPTVKPVELMRWLVRLVTPPGGTVLDPFLGSGTTAVAAILEGFEWIGCELTDDYLPIIQARTEWAEQNRPEPDLTLFGEPEC